MPGSSIISSQSRFQGFFPTLAGASSDLIGSWIELLCDEMSLRSGQHLWVDAGTTSLETVGNGGVFWGEPRLPNGPTDSSPRPNLWQIEEFWNGMVSQTSTVSLISEPWGGPFWGGWYQVQSSWSCPHGFQKKGRYTLVIIWISWTNPFIAILSHVMSWIFSSLHPPQKRWIFPTTDHPPIWILRCSPQWPVAAHDSHAMREPPCRWLQVVYFDHLVKLSYLPQPACTFRRNAPYLKLSFGFSA